MNACDIGFVVAYSKNNLQTSFEEGSLYLWEPSSIAAGVSALESSSCSLCISVPGDTMSGITMRVIRLEDGSWLCVVIAWSFSRITSFNILCPTTGPLFLDSQFESAVSFNPIAVIINSDASRTASIEQRKIILRSDDLRRLQAISCPAHERGNISSVAFCGAHLDDILIGLENGAIYWWDLQTDSATFKFQSTTANDICQLLSVYFPHHNTLHSMHCISGTREGKLIFLERLPESSQRQSSIATTTGCRERGTIDLMRVIRSTPSSEVRKSACIPLAMCAIQPVLKESATNLEHIDRIVQGGARGFRQQDALVIGCVTSCAIFFVSFQTLDILRCILLDEIGVTMAQLASISSPAFNWTLDALACERMIPSVGNAANSCRDNCGERLSLAVNFTVVVLASFSKSLTSLVNGIDISVRIGEGYHRSVGELGSPTRYYQPKNSCAVAPSSPRSLLSPIIESIPNDIILRSEEKAENGPRADPGLLSSAAIMHDCRLQLTVSIDEVPEDSILRVTIGPRGELIRNQTRNTLQSISDKSKTQERPHSVRGDWEAPSRSRSGKILDKPTTFHSIAKSSGYGQHPSNPLEILQQRRQQKLRIEAEKRRELRSNSAPAEKVGVRLRQYPMTCRPPNHHAAERDYSQALPIRGMCFSGDASSLALITTDSTLLVTKLAASHQISEGHAYRGHNGNLTSAVFSYDKKLILTASTDGTARVWCRGKEEVAELIFSHTKHSVADPDIVALRTPGGSSSSSKSFNSTNQRNKPFGQPIKNASFFFQDRFIALTTNAMISLYAYSLAKCGERGSSSKYSRIHSWRMDAHSVSAISTMNSISCPLIFCGTSDRKLHILDAAVGSIARVVNSPHERPIHHIALPTPSIHAPLPVDAYNLFATIATDNVVSIWDLRAAACAARFSSHVNRREEIKCSFSPCLRFIGVGSEDRYARLVDIIAAREIVKLQPHPQHRDVVSDVAFNPLFPELATCSYDGVVKFFVDPTIQ